MGKKNNIYTFDNLSQTNALLHGISTKAFGSMKQLDGSLDCHNLEQFRKSLSLSERAVCMHQIHSGTVRIVDEIVKDPLPDTDGLVTKQKHIPLAVLTADCLPILFYDTKEKIIGVAHAGYQGVLNGIIAQMMQTFRSLGSKPDDMLVGIGPGIGGCCYSIPDERVRLFQKTFPDITGYITKRSGKWFLELSKLAVHLLQREGISPRQIELSGICTAENTQTLYSYRKGDTNGRFVSIISLR